jgi:hypothetical protein
VASLGGKLRYGTSADKLIIEDGALRGVLTGQAEGRFLISEGCSMFSELPEISEVAGILQREAWKSVIRNLKSLQRGLPYRHSRQTSISAK